MLQPLRDTEVSPASTDEKVRETADTTVVCCPSFIEKECEVSVRGQWKWRISFSHSKSLAHQVLFLGTQGIHRPQVKNAYTLKNEKTQIWRGRSESFSRIENYQEFLKLKWHPNSQLWVRTHPAPKHLVKLQNTDINEKYSLWKLLTEDLKVMNDIVTMLMKIYCQSRNLFQLNYHSTMKGLDISGPARKVYSAYSTYRN